MKQKTSVNKIKHSNLNLIDIHQIPWLTVSISVAQIFYTENFINGFCKTACHLTIDLHLALSVENKRCIVKITFEINFSFRINVNHYSTTFQKIFTDGFKSLS